MLKKFTKSGRSREPAGSENIPHGQEFQPSDSMEQDDSAQQNQDKKSKSRRPPSMVHIQSGLADHVTDTHVLPYRHGVQATTPKSMAVRDSFAASVLL